MCTYFVDIFDLQFVHDTINLDIIGFYTTINLVIKIKEKTNYGRKKSLAF